MTENLLHVAWFGLGRLGGPLAENLASSGYVVHGYDPDPAARERLAETAVALYADPSTVPEVDVMATCLRSATDIEQAWDLYQGSHGRFAPAAVLDFSTIAPDASDRLARRLAEQDTALLRVAVSGSAEAASARQVAFICSGPETVYRQMEGLLDLLGRSRTWVGEAEEARAVKLAINLIVGAGLAALIEAVHLAEELGIDRKAFLDVVATSAVASPFYAAKTPALANRDYSPAATTMLMHKDLKLVIETAEKRGQTLPLAAVSTELYERCLQQGWAEKDFACLDELYDTLVHAPHVS